MRFRRYAMAAAGPVAVAGANFLVSFSMLRLEAPGTFGTFTFLFAAAMFTVSLSGALFGAPMQALQTADQSSRSAIVATVVPTATVTAFVACPVFVLVGLALGLEPFAAIFYGAFGMLTILRSVGRAWCYVAEQPWRVTISDVSYAVVTLGILAVNVGWVHVASERAVYPALAFGMAAAVASLGLGFVTLLCSPRRVALRRYAATWQAQSRWSLLSVTATEAVANAHIYLLTTLVGAVAVAPIAASALLVRPINVIQNALIEYERPQMARFLETGAMWEVDRSIVLFRVVLLLVWTVTIIFSGAIVLFRPDLVFPGSYDLATVRLGATLWAAVSLIIVIQVPNNVLLQAGGDFRELAQASLWASVVSVPAVLLVIAIAQPVWTVAAILPGWLVSTIVVHHGVRDFRRRIHSRTAEGTS
ncbi:hypothetical protein [Sphingomonas sp. HMP9]|uniref:hypothetical protein n=1 Tax=Sphingomonas sp. HMP9 TaxID=1517554 RepID=UPI001597104F|nr:hypothetical protein [Sphingomonas sp. HMP9]